MTREEFLARWDSERATYDAWGWHVTKTIVEAIAADIAPDPVKMFIKVPAEPRCKDDQKLVVKAFYRGKPYDDPYEQITDKVGTRFVLLLGSDVNRVARLVERIPGWTTSKDRDYEREQNENPIVFDYAAVHYVVRPDNDVDLRDCRVPAKTPCEVQIKTLLQHAYSELTHDTIYKPQIQATATMRRNAAKSMALLEATNDYFEKVAEDVREALAKVRALTNRLSAVYQEATGLDANPSALEGILLDAYANLVPEDLERDVRSLFREHPQLIERIQRRVAERDPLFAQPSILLTYLDIAQRRGRAKRDWPLTPAEMEPILNDMGEGMDWS